MKTLPEQISEMHRKVDEAAGVASGNRTCGLCGGELFLKQGRHSAKWFYRHVEEGCGLDRLGNAILFNTREEADKADVVFNEL